MKYHLLFASGHLWLFLAVFAAAFAAGTAFAYLGWRRAGSGMTALLMEEARLLALTLLAATLLAPELVHQEPSPARPVLAVLTDVSTSMDSRDVVDASGKRLLTRLEWARGWTSPKNEPWAKLAERYELVFSDFAATPEPDSSRAETLSATDLGLALRGALKRHPGLRAILLASDGQGNKGEPPAKAAELCRELGAPIFVVGVGRSERLPDLRIEKVNAPSSVLLGDHVALQCELANYLPEKAEGKLLLKGADGKLLDSAAFSLESGASDWANLLWEPLEAGDYDLEVKLPVRRGDVDPGNNRRSFHLKVVKEDLKALLVESEPRWEYRFLRNALIRDPNVDVDCLLLRPGLGTAEGDHYLRKFPEPKELMGYDVVFLGDVAPDGPEFTLADVASLTELLRRRGGGLILIPGPEGRLFDLLKASPELAELSPVAFDPAGRLGTGHPPPQGFMLTFKGRGSLLTRLTSDPERNEAVWRALPGFNWRAGALRAKGDAEVLAVCANDENEFGKIPLLATRRSDEALALYLGTDSVWRWRRGVEDLHHYRFWGQIIRCMARKRHMGGAGGGLVHSPELPEAMSPVSVQARLNDPQGLPLRDAAVTLSARGPDGAASSWRMEELPGGWGVYKAVFTPEVPGRYELAAKVAGDAAAGPTAVVQVRASAAEKLGDPENAAASRELGRLSGGAYAPCRAADQALASLLQLPEKKPKTIRLPLWNQWWWACSIAALLSLHWLWRKRRGLP